jgi:hypothetical protein
VNTPGIPVNAEIWDGCVYVADGVGGICAVDLAKSGVSLGAGAAASDGGEAPAVADFQTGFFRGATVERCVQTGEKALAILAAQRERTDFTQVLTVENTAGEGEGSLAWCLANVPAGGKITFDTSVFPPSEPATIFVKEGILLDFDLENVTIDASERA